MTSKTLKSLLVGGLSLASLVLVAANASAGDSAAPAPQPAVEAPAPAPAPAAEPAKPADAAKPEASEARQSSDDDEDDDEVADEDLLKAQDEASMSMAKDLSPTLKPIYDLGDGESKGKRIKIKAWVDRKDLTYEIGDTLKVYVAPKQDAYITILNVGSSGRVAVIYPNHYQRDAKVKGGKVVRIPSKKAKWNIEVGGPRGIDLIKVIASRKPLTLKELQGLAAADEKNPLITLGRSADDVGKDLSPQLKPDADEGDEVEAKFGVRNILVRVRRGD